jgi:hypothetical protein
VLYRHILFVAGLMVASTAQAQMPERTSFRSVPGRTPSIISAGGSETAVASLFNAEVRGDLATSASGEAEFGTVQATDGSSAAFVVSLGVTGHQSAILFTRRSGTPLGVGRYRISEGANGADEILALVITGLPTNPTGAFRGQSGWLVVTAASDRFIIGRFQVDAIGFLAAEPQREDRHVNVTGSLSATAASWSEDAE